MNGMTKQHRIASYNDGCRCDECREAARVKGMTRRARIREGRDRQADDQLCIFCFGWFRPKGAVHHERACAK